MSNQGARELILSAQALGRVQVDGGRGPAGRTVSVAQEVLAAIRDA